MLWSLIPSMSFFTVGFDSFISTYQREGNDIYMEIQCAVCLLCWGGGGGGGGGT